MNTIRPLELSDRMLCPRHVAAMFGVDPKTVRRWATEGKIPHIMTPGGHRRFSERQMHLLMQNLSQ